MSRNALVRSAVLLPFLLVACEQPPPEPEQQKPAPKPAATPVAALSANAPPTASVKPPEPPQPKGLPAPEDVAAPPKDAKKTASGLFTKVLTKGTGKDKPKLEDRVKVHYTGWTKDGRCSTARWRGTTLPPSVWAA
ncbi:MAG: hypothetical protein HS104_05160 [Polyangiaceae bacterium]|nr:hypothetical protein [Polyangiaceae bacterium]